MQKSPLTAKEESIGDSGQSLVEILIALTIFSLVMSATALLFFSGQNFLGASFQSRKAIEKAHDGVEALRFIRDENWTNLTNGLHGLTFTGSKWQLTSTPDWSEDFKRTVSISTDIDGLKHIDLTVQWHEPTEGTKSIELAQLLAPLEQGISGDWGSPCILSTADGGTGSKGTDVFYSNGKAYVTSSAASAGKEDLFIFDVTDTSHPTLLGSLNIEQGLKSVTVSGNYAYVIEDGSSDFFVVDVTNSAAPVKIAKINLNNAAGKYVMVRGNYVYATTAQSSANPEFFVIDVSTPGSPSVVASLEIGADVNEVNVLQNIAYLATSADGKELDLIDVSDPLNPFEISNGYYDAVGSADGRAVQAKNKQRIYLGRTDSTNNNFLILDASDPSNITLRGSKDTGTDILSLISVETLSFLGTSDTNEEFQDYYIRDPTNPVKNATLNFSNIATGADYHNNIVFMSVMNNDILQLVTSEKNGICDD